MSNNSLYILTMEATVIFDNLKCQSLINNVGILFITEEHNLYLKAKNKKYNFKFQVDKNGPENNALPNVNYNQKEDIESVKHHYNYVIDIKEHKDKKNYNNIWVLLHSCVKNYKTPLSPACKNTDDEQKFKRT